MPKLLFVLRKILKNTFIFYLGYSKLPSWTLLHVVNEFFVELYV